MQSFVICFFVILSSFLVSSEEPKHVKSQQEPSRQPTLTGVDLHDPFLVREHGLGSNDVVDFTRELLFHPKSVEESSKFWPMAMSELRIILQNSDGKLHEPCICLWVGGRINIGAPPPRTWLSMSACSHA